MSLFAFISPGTITTDTYLSSVKPWVFAGAVILAFGVFSVPAIFFRRLNTDKLALLVSCLTYAITIASRLHNVYFSVAVTAAVSVCFAYIFNAPDNPADFIHPDKTATVAVIAMLGCFCVFFIGSITVCRYLSFSAPNYDFGIFANMFANMRRGFLPDCTCERDQLLSHFAVHVSPIYYLILPFYLIFPSPVTLQVAQAVVLASGVIPLYLLVKQLGMSNRAAMLLSAAYCFYPALSGGCMYDIHENCFLAPLLLWLFYLHERNLPIPMYIVAALVLFVKEDAAIYVIFFAVYLLLTSKNKPRGMLLLAFSAFYFTLVLYLLSEYGSGVMTYRYDNYIPGEGGLIDAVVTVIKNPALALYNISLEKKLPYLLTMLVPLCFLPFITRKPARIILVAPFLLINLMTDYVYQYDLYFQYGFGSLAFLFYASALNASELPKNTRRFILPLVMAASIIMFSSTVAQKNYYISKYTDNTGTYELMEEVLDRIPEDASVRSSTFLLAHIADREEIYILKTKNYAEYAAVDLRYTPEMTLDELYGLGYEDVVVHEGLIAILKMAEQPAE